MALSLKRPGDVAPVDGARVAGGIHGRAGNLPTWGVGDPVVTAMSGLQQSMERYAKVYDDVQVNSYLQKKSAELNRLYNDPETGLFYTRRGKQAEGMYDEYKQTMTDMWEKDAKENLTEHQRALLSKPMQHLVESYAHRVAHHETSEKIGAAKEDIANTVYEAKNLVASGNFTEDDLGNALNSINIAYASLGKLEGWDAATIKRKQEEEAGDMLTKAAAGLAATNPTAAMGMLKTYRSMIPAAVYEPAMRAMQKHVEAENKRRVAAAQNAAVNADIESLKALSPDEQTAAIMAKYGNNPKMLRKALAALTEEQKARDAITKYQEKQQLSAALQKTSQLAQAGDTEENWEAVKAIADSMPNEAAKKKVLECYTRTRGAASGESGGYTDPAVKQDIEQRMADGEEVDIEAYAGRLSNADYRKLQDKNYRQVVKTVKPEFEQRLGAWFGANKKAAKAMGFRNETAVWNAFLARMSPEARTNPAKMREEMDDFLKDALLNGNGLFTSSTTLPAGLVPDTLEQNPGKYLPARGTEAWNRTVKRLEKSGAKKDGFGGLSYSDDQVSAAYGEEERERKEKAVERRKEGRNRRGKGENLSLRQDGEKPLDLYGNTDDVNVKFSH